MSQRQQPAHGYHGDNQAQYQQPYQQPYQHQRDDYDAQSSYLEQYHTQAAALPSSPYSEVPAYHAAPHQRQTPPSQHSATERALFPAQDHGRTSPSYSQQQPSPSLQPHARDQSSARHPQQQQQQRQPSNGSYSDNGNHWHQASGYDQPATSPSPIYDPVPAPSLSHSGHFKTDSISTNVDLSNTGGLRNRQEMSYHQNGHNNPDPYPFQSYGAQMSYGHSQGSVAHTAEDEKSVYSKTSVPPSLGYSSDYPHSTVEMAQPSLPPPTSFSTGYGRYTPGPPPGARDPYMSSGGLGQPGFVIAPAPMQNYQARDPSAWAQNREKIMRRRTVKRVELQDGNLVIDVPVAQSISQQSGSDNPEFSQMRYQAVTCDPDDFVAKRYTLRPWLYGRKCEIAIVMTAYNEDDVLFARTMGGVIKNIAHLCQRNRSKMWGAEAWKKVVVIVVSDGRKKANERMLKALGLMGCYNEAVMKDHVLKQQVQAHVFEYTTRVQVTDKGEVRVAPCPIQVVFCLKEQNKKKLNSHRWYFNSFCKLLQPNVCVLLDVGTKPTGTSIYELWKSFDKHANVGGACGEICVDVGTGCGNLFNPLVASQNFEYKLSNVLDKPTESTFGFISVLPGAFSAYRYKALLGRPLEMYFKGELLHGGGAEGGVFTSNMYLAEDRILCFELVTKQREAWLLRYVKSAKAYTDVPDRVPELISQRRRWLNGSLFASYYAVWHWYRIFSSGQGFLRKLFLFIQVIYNFFQLVFSWFAIANFFLAFHFLLDSSNSIEGKDGFGGQGKAVSEISQNIFIAMILVVLICSLGNRPQGSNLAYTSAIVVFGIIMGLALYCAGYTTYLALDAGGLTTTAGWNWDNLKSLFATSSFRDIVISLAATYVLYWVASIIHLEPWHMFTSFLQYLFLMPTYIIILAIYSMCNTNDLSWGTKAQTGPATDLGSATSTKADGKSMVEVKVTATSQDAEELWRHYRDTLSVPEQEVHQKRDKATKMEDHARNFRTNMVLLWMATNTLVILIFTSSWWTDYVQKRFGKNSKDPVLNPYQSVIFWSNAGLAAFRAIGSITYLILRLFGH
ncbi:Chitin synthase, class 2 [Thecaphora frezii]|nr:putative chitin synthase 2 [Thecaphora frezii]